MKENINFIDTDVLVIGSGIAGLIAAVEVSKKGRQSLLVSKSPIENESWMRRIHIKMQDGASVISCIQPI